MATCHPNLIGFNITNIFSINTSYKRQVPGLNKNANSRVHLVPCTYVAVYVHQIRWTIYKELFIKKNYLSWTCRNKCFTFENELNLVGSTRKWCGSTTSGVCPRPTDYVRNRPTSYVECPVVIWKPLVDGKLGNEPASKRTYRDPSSNAFHEPVRKVIPTYRHGRYCATGEYSTYIYYWYHKDTISRSRQ